MKNSFSSLSDLASAFGKSADSSDKNTVQGNTQSNNGDNNLVYSTGSGRIKEKKVDNTTPSDGFARVRRETKGRKGKGVIVISGLGLNAPELKDLAKKLKKTCGTGGSVVGETIEVQGDKRDIIKKLLEQAGFKVKFTGG
jgi:translation initiation factor 1